MKRLMGATCALLICMQPLYAQSAQSQSAEPGSPPAKTEFTPLPWAVYYHLGLSPNDLAPYKLIILDITTDINVHELVNRDKQVFGYISIGEIGSHRSDFEVFAQKNLLLRENPYWPGSHMIDMRDPRWVKHIIEVRIPQLLHQGFNGLFLDTLDNAGELERQDSEANKGMVDAASRIVSAIRMHYPNVPIIQNRGYELLPQTADLVDFVMAESLMADHNFETKDYYMVPEDLMNIQLEWLAAARTTNPKLKILALDYWNPDDPETLKNIYKTQRTRGFHPYVSTVELNRIVSEPK